MGQETGIAWTDHTFNPWWGCHKVSQACRSCYAEALSGRFGLPLWGLESPRRFFGEKHWGEPLAWNTRALKDGVRRKVFCASMSDVFEQLPDGHAQTMAMTEARKRLWSLIELTPGLDWLLLTKRPQNVLGMVPWAWSGQAWHSNPGPSADAPAPISVPRWPVNAWVGFTAEDQANFDARWPHARRIPAPVLFMSVEPQLGPIWLPPDALTVSAPHCGSLGWVICGGESGSNARRLDPLDVALLRDQCVRNRIPFFFKQTGVVLAKELGLLRNKGDALEELPESIRFRQFPVAP